MIDYEKKYPEILRPTAKKTEEKKEEGEKKASGGVLIQKYYLNKFNIIIPKIIFY